jgi:hypothetical protein
MNDNFSVETVAYINSRLGVKLDENNECYILGDADSNARIVLSVTFARGQYEIELISSAMDGDQYDRVGVYLAHAEHASLVQVVKLFKTAYAARFSRFGL